MVVSSAVLIEMIIENKRDLRLLSDRSDRWSRANESLQIERRRRRQNQARLSDHQYRNLRARCEFFKPHYRMLENRRDDLRDMINELEIMLSKRDSIRVWNLAALNIVRDIHDRLEWIGQVRNEGNDEEVIVGPENRTATSEDNFLRVNLIGDFFGYSSIPTFEDFYLVIPRQGAPGQPNDMGKNISMWMLLERVRFTLDGVECNKIGVSYEAFNEVLNSNLLIELRADDIDFVFQRSPGKIMSVTVPTFEALTQFGVATITVTNTGEVETSYSLTFDCSKGVSLMEEQFFIMKPKEISAQPFKVYPTTDQAAKYVCSAILKDSEFSEVDRAECQFSTTATVFDNGSQITPFQPPKTDVNGFAKSLKKIWKNLWGSLVDFISGETCRRKCSGFFDFSCLIQYICLSWIVLFGLLLAIFPTALVLLWLLHQKGFFDPLYDWFEDHFGYNDHKTSDIHRHGIGNRRSRIHAKKHIKTKHHKHDSRYNRSGIHHDRRHNHPERESNHHHYLHHVRLRKMRKPFNSIATSSKTHFEDSEEEEEEEEEVESSSEEEKSDDSIDSDEVARDPRFESLCGTLDVDGFRRRYNFLFESNLPAEREKRLKKTKDPKVTSELKNHISWITGQNGNSFLFVHVCSSLVTLLMAFVRNMCITGFSSATDGILLWYKDSYT
ncbi:hypothetical protein V6N12_018994 [Hibiscus sabdariffa]|uniref:Generative cell specific-1/HAP2 domain-containing protein n=1 Tax=Hibiscus sabdariffa TaxID=183260 RepID=A0ABR2BA71_9ROSI